MAARPSHMSFITPCTDTSRVITVVNVRNSAYVQSRSTRGSTPRRRCRAAATRSRVISTIDGQQRSDGLAGPREVAEVARPGPALLAPAGAAHGQHRPLGIAGEQVAVARTVVSEQPVAVGMRTFDRRGTLGMVRHDDRAGRLVEPTEGGHVGRRAVQDPALADAGLRRPAGLPPDEAVAAVAEPPVQVGYVARSEGPAEHGVGDAVELDEHHTGDVGHVGAARAFAGLT